MVDVQFDDVDWVERRPEKNLRKRNPPYDPNKEQLRRVVQAIYKDDENRDLGRAYSIATRQLQKHGYLEEGTQTPTEKGRKRASKKLKTPDAVMKRQGYENMLSKNRKNRYRVVEQKKNGRTVYAIQPSGKWFYTEFKAQRVANAWNKGEKQQPLKKAANPRYLDERDGMSSFDLDRRARNALQEARALGEHRKSAEKRLKNQQGTKGRHEKLRVAIRSEIDDVDRAFFSLRKKILSDFEPDRRGLPTQKQLKAMGALNRAYRPNPNVPAPASTIRAPRGKGKSPTHRQTDFYSKVKTGQSSDYMRPFLGTQEIDGKLWYLVTYTPPLKWMTRLAKEAGLRKIKNVTNRVWSTELKGEAPQFSSVGKAGEWRVWDNEKDAPDLHNVQGLKCF